MKKLEHELVNFKMNGVVPPAKFLDSINLLLTDDAAEWAETNPESLPISQLPSAVSMITDYRKPR